MSNHQRVAFVPLRLAACLVLGLAFFGTGAAEAGTSNGTLDVRVRVVHPCEVGAAVSKNSVSCKRHAPVKIGRDRRGKSAYRPGKNFHRRPPIVIHTDHARGFRTIVF